MPMLHEFFPQRLLLALLCVAALSGCSREARKAGIVAKADQYFKAGEYEKAEIEYKNVLQLARNDSHSFGRLGAIYLDQGRLFQSVGLLKTAVELQAENLEAQVKLGYANLAFGKRAEAREAALFVLGKNPTNPEAPLLLAESIAVAKDAADARAVLEKLPSAQAAPALTALGLIHLRERKIPEAEAILQRALEADPKFVAAHSTLAGLYLAQKDTVRAEKALAIAMEFAPLRSAARIQFAHVQVQAGKVDVAKRVLDEAISKVPDFLPSHLLRANIATGEKSYDEAVALLEKLLLRDPLNPEGLVQLAQVQTTKGDLDKALATLEKAVAAYSGSFQIQYLLGNVHLAKGELENASARLAQAVKLSPTPYAPAILGLARVEIRQRNFVSAISSLQAFLKENPGHGEAELLLAEAYRNQGNTDAALRIYRALAEANPKNAQLQFMIGSILIQQDNKAEARKVLTSAIELAPDFLPPLELLVNLDLADKQYSTAEGRVEAQMSNNPTNASLQLLLAKIYLAQSNNAKAEATLQKAISLQPDAVLPYTLLSQLYLSSGQSEKALSSLQSIAAKTPGDAKSHLLIGVLLEEKKDYAGARAAYEKVLAINPKSTSALNNLAYLLSERFGEVDKALDLAQQARSQSPNQPESLDTLGWLLFRKQQYARAAGLLEESAQKLPDNAEAQFHVGMAHYMMGREDAARQALERAVHLGKDGSFAEEARGALSLLALDPKKANDAMRKTLQEALERRKNDPIVLSRLAALHEREGNVEKAIAAYEAALNANPNNVDAVLNAVRLYRSRNETGKALELAKATRKLAPSDGRIAHVLGRLAFESKDYRWSVGVLQEAVRQHARDAELQFDLAEASFSIGQVSTAETAFQEALAIDAQFSRAAKAREYLDLIALSQNPTQATGAAGRVADALKADPSNAAALFVQGIVDQQKKDPTAAKRAFEKALARFPDFAPAKRHLTILLSAHPEDDKKALILASEAREAYPSDPELAKAFGVILFREGNHTRAASLLQESARTMNADAEVLYYLGMSQRKLNDPVASTRSLQQALELGLSPKLEADARRALAAKN